MISVLHIAVEVSMNQSSYPNRSYKFDFIKDRFWIWFLVLPFGLICFAVPLVVYFGLKHLNGQPDWFPFFGLVILGIPCYLVGWIFLYSVMEYVYTKVTISENQVDLRLPSLMLPILPVHKQINLDQVHRIDTFARYGSRVAIFLYFYHKNKERHFYLPKFRFDQEYLEVVKSLRMRIESRVPQPEHQSPVHLGGLPASDPKQVSPQRSLRTYWLDRLLHELIVYSFLANLVVSGWIFLAQPPSGLEAFIIGMSLGAALSIAVIFLSNNLIISPILIWFFGRWLIKTAAFLLTSLNIDLVMWRTPAWINSILAWLQIEPVRASSTEYFFWSLMALSTLVSLQTIKAWMQKRAWSNQNKKI